MLASIRRIVVFLHDLSVDYLYNNRYSSLLRQTEIFLIRGINNGAIEATPCSCLEYSMSITLNKGANFQTRFS